LVTRRLALALALLAGVTASCRRADEQEARAAVMTYLDKLTQAYGASDETIVDPLVSEHQGRKLTGLIGVKRDMGMVLDARLLELQLEGTCKEGEELIVDTRERWHYRDLALATHKQIGEDSLDAYAVRYRLVREQGTLKIETIEFREPPIVGRKPPRPAIDARLAHGVPIEARAGSTRPPPPTSPPARR
jgi:hypothetical protein